MKKAMAVLVVLVVVMSVVLVSGCTGGGDDDDDDMGGDDAYQAGAPSFEFPGLCVSLISQDPVVAGR